MSIQKLQSVTVVAEAEKPPLLELKIQCNTMEAYGALVNLLGVIQWNGGVGHSAITAAFFDGDGADQVTIEGLPDGPYVEMAQALSSYGDGLMGLVSAHTAVAYNGRSGEVGHNEYYRTTVWPPEKAESS